MSVLAPLHASIRPIALCVFRHQGRILVSDEVDPVSGERFHRPLGGGIEYGETSAEAVVREIREELGAELLEPRLLGVLENHFTFAGKQGHEVVFVYDGRFRDATRYAAEELVGDEAGIPMRAIWLDLAAEPEARLYPSGLRGLVAKSASPGGRSPG